MEKIQELAYLQNKDGKVVGIKLPTGINFIKDGDRGFLMEFDKKRYGDYIRKQLCDPKKTVIGFGIELKEKEWIKFALDGCSKL